MNLDRLRVRLNGAATRTTDREIDIVSGTLVGGEPRRVVVRVDDRTSEPQLSGREFSAPVKLLPGVNHVRVVAMDASGHEVEERVTVHYAPPVTRDVVITSPRDGHTLTADDPPLVVVQGHVDDANVSTVRLIANDRQVMVPVTQGRFRYVVPVLESTLRLRAETGSEARGSATVTVHASAALPSIGLVLADWPRGASGPPQLTVWWRPNPGSLDGAGPPVPLSSVALVDGETGDEFFYLRNARPGVYTFVLNARTGSLPDVRPIVYVGGAGGTLRSLRPALIGQPVIARLLFPHGVLWDQDDWFTGRSATGETVTKFRFPEGVSWTERVRDVGR